VVEEGRSLVGGIRESLPHDLSEDFSIRGVKLGGFGIEIGHDPIAVHADDGVGRGSEKLRETFGEAIFFALGGTFLGDIAEHQHDAT